jgi:altronate dehydratase small subunit
MAEQSPPRALILNDDDDVAVLVTAAAPGSLVLVQLHGAPLSLEVRQSLPSGHKIALRYRPRGHHVRKYGEVICALKEAVSAGDHVHVHNLASLRGG